MKTSHQLAAELLALPDLPLSVDRWGGEDIEIHHRDHSDGEVISLEPADDGYRINLDNYEMTFVPLIKLPRFQPQ